MQVTQPLSPVRHAESNITLPEEAPVSAVSWPAIIGGAFVAAAMASGSNATLAVRVRGRVRPTCAS